METEDDRMVQCLQDARHQGVSSTAYRRGEPDCSARARGMIAPKIVAGVNYLGCKGG
jgi:hypothetical protein